MKHKSINEDQAPVELLDMDAKKAGQDAYDLATKLFPIARSITGNGVRETLNILGHLLPNLTQHEVPTGTQCFDWNIPKEWNIKDAYIVGPNGKRIIDFCNNNLHVVGYSVPVNINLTLDELQPYLHSLPEQPDAIPYITSYYNEQWGFCLTHHQREGLQDGTYHVVIDSTLEQGHLTYGELIIPGESNKEVFLSTYICHPSMGNNELSGPTVTTMLARWLKLQYKLRYTYRIIFIPETIGSIYYLSKNLKKMQKNTVAGFNISCIGDSRDYSYLPSKNGETLADRIAQHVLDNHAPSYTKYSFLDRRSDERQYCSVGVDLPVVTVARTLYWHYPEYHTSKDDLTVISPEGLGGGYMALRRCVECLEGNRTMKVTTPCEPQLGKRGLYPTLSRGRGNTVYILNELTAMDLLNMWAYSNGDDDLLEVADKIGVPMWNLLSAIEAFENEGLLSQVNND